MKVKLKDGEVELVSPIFRFPYRMSLQEALWLASELVKAASKILMEKKCD